MLEMMKWNDVYALWDCGRYNFLGDLSAPVTAEHVPVKYEREGCYFYGFDWLRNDMAQGRKSLIQKEPAVFLYLTAPTNKGTIQTAGMLVEAQSDEERAAIWIAATAKELRECYGGNCISRYSAMLYMVACEFLKDRYALWHHAMKKLVPDIMIPYSILESISCKDAEPVIGLIQMNTALVKNDFSILQYSSFAEGESPKHLYRIIH